jgi:hypothetical protein
MWSPIPSSTFSFVLLTCAFLTPLALAQKGVTVPQSFRIRVSNDGRPKAGILVNLQQGRPPQLGPAVRSEVTDRNGEVRVQGISPGDFTVRTAEWDRNDAVVISVTRGNATTHQISLIWPNLSMHHVRELRGTIHERRVRVTAFKMQSGERVGSALTDDSGRFAIPNARPGEYLLRLMEEGPKTSLQIHGDIGIAVDKNAANAEVDLFLEMQRGAMSYGSFCHLPLNFKVTHLCGQIIDEHGTTLAGIRVSYRDSRGARHSIITDNSGSFDVKDSKPYETFLEITGPGYIPLRASGIRKGSELTCQRPMRITLPKEENGFGCRSVRGID